MQQQPTRTTVSGAQTPAQQRYRWRSVLLEGFRCRACGRTETTRAQVARNQRKMQAALTGLMPLMIPPRHAAHDD